MSNTQKQAARQFVKEWTGKGYEKGETQRFWIDLLHTVFGIDNPTKMMEFELPVKTITKEKGADFIDAYIHSTKVLIEQKGSHVDLSAKARQSDGAELTPYQQGRRYAAGLPVSMTPRWIVVCNFQTFEVHDMEHPNDAPQIIQLADLEKEYHRLSFLVDDTNIHLKKELEVSIQAGEIVGVLYDKILAQYKDPSNPESQKALNKLCVRLVFCLYAEDAGIFGSKDMFHDYMSRFSANDFRRALIELFQVLDTKPEERDPYMDEGLAAFPYVNGGMFAGEIEIPRINEEIRGLILQRASDDFDWSLISPTIFGAVFESTLNPETRRAGGMHYTSIENIHKVIDPLFLDDLKAELADIKATSVAKTRKDRAYAFQDKISKLKFFDPACGSGNFLTESYTSLRRLENEALRIIYGGDRVIGEMADPIKVSINQFYGIEINDFACSVAQTALWIAESQMMQETDEIVGFSLDPLPLKTYTNIHEGNALRMDWNDVIPASKLDYIMGNPPFVGARWLNAEQREDIKNAFGPKWKNSGILDYVCCWYKKAFDYMNGTKCRAALVSTNSITQGEHVAAIWKPLFEMGFHFDFAHRTFIWDSEASEKAHVHCVILGFSTGHSERQRRIYNPNGFTVAQNINGYLLDAPGVFIESRVKPLCDVPEIRKGNQPTDGGNLIIEKEDYDEFIKKEPAALPYIKRFFGAKEYLNNIPRYCLWLVNIPPSQLKAMPAVMDRVTKVREMRLASSDPGTHRLADTPTVFRETNNPEHAIVIPEVSSERRRYVPMSFIGKEVICSNKLQIIPNANQYEFGILESSVHMAWMRVVCGRLKSDYDYSKKIVYNNFPWPSTSISESAKRKIEQTAQSILDARSLYPTESLANLYDETLMPPELRRAHRANDAAVLEAYGFPKDATESDIVARLFKMYQELTRTK
ncbi:MAG: class I SAM-dependent DNA methyltransferase [Bacteroidales bacterium]|nr:class I SAM-dependent DNA methyltransferase [Bacteroidales bacterium]